MPVREPILTAQDSILNEPKQRLMCLHGQRRMKAQGLSVVLAVTLSTTAWVAGTAAEAGSQLRPWREYRTIMWVGDSASKRSEKLPLFYQRLREMGINTAMVYGDADPQPLLANHFPYYVENIINRGLCLKWSSKVRDWDHPRSAEYARRAKAISYQFSLELLVDKADKGNGGNWGLWLEPTLFREPRP